MSSNSTVIDLIRHGEPVGGVKIRGWLDDPLSETGWQQMWRAVGEGGQWDRIICSPLSRCAEFAHQLAQREGLPLEQQNDLREIGFGEWEGADPAALYDSEPEQVSNFWADPAAHPPPGGEPLGEFQQRVTAVLERLIDSYQGERLLLVAHGGVNRMLLAQVLGMPLSHLFRMEVPYASLSRIRIEEGLARLVFHDGCLT